LEGFHSIAVTPAENSSSPTLKAGFWSEAVTSQPLRKESSPPERRKSEWKVGGAKQVDHTSAGTPNKLCAKIFVVGVRVRVGAGAGEEDKEEEIEWI
tara:strand:- start:505 stop:795 length:291 start_codon:yes stop_codon:yes gene_type:complete